MVKKTFTFENFCVGEENKIAFLAAQRVLEMPGAIFNPLYIYSDVGLGKSHLLAAIYQAFSAKLTTKLVNGLEFVEALKHPNAADYKQEIKAAECLVFDDLHLLRDDTRALDELFLILEHFLTENHQLVVSANGPPQDLTNFDSKIRSRLEGGLVCELGHLKETSRVNILRKKAEDRGLILPDEIAQEIARVVKGSVRELEGALNRLIAYSTIAQFPLDLNTTRLALRDYYRTRSAEPVMPSLIEELKTEAYQAISMVEGEALAREEFKEKIYIWEMKGFDVSALKPLLNQDMETLKLAYEAFVDKVKRLVELQKEFGSIDARRFPAEAMAIERVLFSPDKVDEFEKRMQGLHEMLALPKFEKTFDSYIVGECNEVVYGLGQDMIKNLGKKLNPFVVVGQKGWGKSHLLFALADRIQKDHPDFVVRYFNLAESFPFEAADVLVLDNVDFLAEVRRAEFAQLLSQYVKEDRQIIVSSSVPSLSLPWSSDIKYLFEFGIDAPLSPPDYKTVAEYIKLKGRAVPAELPEIGSFGDIDDFLDGRVKEEPVPLGFPGEAVAVPPEPVPDIRQVGETAKPEWVPVPSIWNEEVWEEY